MTQRERFNKYHDEICGKGGFALTDYSYSKGGSRIIARFYCNNKSFRISYSRRLDKNYERALECEAVHFISKPRAEYYEN